MRRVLVYAGIDEAGYGPLLGPLCVACTAFVVRDHDRDETVDPVCDLWKRLNNAVCRKRIDKKRRRIAVDDSKLLKGANDGAQHPLKFLERAVLSFLGAVSPSLEGGGQGVGEADHSPRSPLERDGAHSSTAPPTPSPPPSREGGMVSCCTDLFRHLGVRIDPHDWYTTTTPLPVGQTLDELRIAHARLGKTLHEQTISCEMIRCEAIDGPEFNEQVERMGNKANVNLCAALRLIDTVWQRWPGEHPFIAVDHHSGRTHYLQMLMQAYPDAQAQVLAEEETVSAYRLTRNINGVDSTLTVKFLVEAESKHLPVALASMTAKYVRELFMLRMNRHFQGLMPELKPTAGYNEDGRRYLADIEPLIVGQAIDRRRLVRCV